jgi:hypothetical protein
VCTPCAAGSYICHAGSYTCPDGTFATFSPRATTATAAVLITGVRSSCHLRLRALVCLVTFLPARGALADYRGQCLALLSRTTTVRLLVLTSDTAVLLGHFRSAFSGNVCHKLKKLFMCSQAAKSVAVAASIAPLAQSDLDTPSKCMNCWVWRMAVMHSQRFIKQFADREAPAVDSFADFVQLQQLLVECLKLAKLGEDRTIDDLAMGYTAIAVAERRAISLQLEL